MSTASSSIVSRSKSSEVSHDEEIVKKSKVDFKEKKIPALKSNFYSKDKALEKQAWTQQHVSSFEESSETKNSACSNADSWADNADSDQSIDEAQINFMLLAQYDNTGSKHRSSAQDGYTITTTTANTSTTNATDTSATTATTTSNTSIATTTATINTTQASNVKDAGQYTEEQLAWIVKKPYPTISLSLGDLGEKLDLIKMFSASPDVKNLVITLSEDEDISKAISAFEEINRYKFQVATGKEIIVAIDRRMTKSTDFHGLLNTIYKSPLITGLDFAGDAVLKKWSSFKRVLGNTSKAETFQFSGATSDAFCECFKGWPQPSNLMAIDKPPMLRAKTLRFVDFKISDPAVFGSMLGALILKMPKITTLDFSKANLSDDQKNVLRFQLSAIAVDREHLLKF